MLDNIAAYLYLIVLLPFAGFAVNLFFGRFLPRKLVGAVACASVFVAFLVSFAAFWRLRETGEALNQVLYTWFSAGNVNVPMGLRIDQLSAVIILVVSGVGFLIHVYSIGYMGHDVRYSRYFSYLNLFTGFMLLLVLANNLLLMFVGWEGVGLCSYLLIGFWFEKTANAVAGMKAFVVNRIGDFAFTVGLFLLFAYLGLKFGVWTVEVGVIKETLQHHAGALDTGVLTLVGILLFGGACGKSAQLPLFVWLPDAMAGPTPVSALIHAATMVTAGVYLIARMNFLYVLAPVALTVVAVVGALTAIFAATIGLAQNDIKKVLAYSTVSQLGYMFLGVGVGAFSAGIFHLMTHAFFKACLFLGAGSVIHGMSGEQDIRNMGGLRKYMKWTFATFLIATLAIAGIPPFAGFFSKDEILWQTFNTHLLAVPWLGKALWAVAALAAGLTAFYMFRLVFLTFYGNLRSQPAAEHSAHGRHGTADAHATPHESPAVMVVPLVILAALACIGGFVNVPHILGGGAHFEQWMEPVVKMEEGKGNVEHNADAPQTQKDEALHHETNPLEYVLMFASVAIAALGIFVAWAFYVKWEGLPKLVARKWERLYTAVANKYWVDEIYQRVLVEPLLRLNAWLGKFDNDVIDGAVNGAAQAAAEASAGTGVADNYVVDGAVNGSARWVAKTGREVSKLQTGHIRQYVQTAVIGALFLIFVFNVWLLRDHISVWVHHFIGK